MFKIRHCFTCIVRNVSTTKPKNSFRSIPTLAFGKYLFATNTISSGVLMFLGDICQQEIEYRQQKLAKRYDYMRLARMFVVGLGLGPIHHYYYLYIARIMPKRDFVTVTKKVALDQFVMSPICIVTFFYCLGAMELKPVQEITNELTDKFKEVYVMDWCVWTPTQYLNFYFVPVIYQVFYVNAVTMIYNVLLSYIKHRDQAEEAAQQLRKEEAQSIT